MQKYFPSVQKKYYVEPFVGGGALLFWFLNHYGDRFEHMIANDHNRDLIEMYKTVREEVEGLIAELRDLTLAIRSSTDPYAFYLTRRSEYNSTDCTDRVRRSALLIFLNRTCFNGLYRVNREGKFNVPFGKRPFAVIYSAEILRRDSDALKKVEFLCGDYSKATAPKGCNDQAFYYFDPPYRPLNPTSDFSRYTKEVFGEKEQIALALHCQELDKQGAALRPHPVNPSCSSTARNGGGCLTPSAILPDTDDSARAPHSSASLRRAPRPLRCAAG